MILEPYTSLADKSPFFADGLVEIRTKNEFDLVWNQLTAWHNEPDKRWRFRGCGDASWKLFNSAQRFWVEREMSHLDLDFGDFIRNLITSCKGWNKQTVTTFFSNNGISPENELALLSYMQHYSLPTPLLDFTANPFVALFFALEKQSSTGLMANSINSFCSVYAVDERNRFFKDIADEFSDLRAQASLPDVIRFDDLIGNFVILPLDRAVIRDFKMSNNTNISNQDGLFFLNSHPTIPIEALYARDIRLVANSMTAEEFASFGYANHFARCFNFHKSLRNYALARLRDEQVARITPDFIYPDTRKMAETCLNEVLEKL